MDWLDFFKDLELNLTMVFGYLGALCIAPFAGLYFILVEPVLDCISGLWQ